MINYRKHAVKTIENVFWDALELCDDWCNGELYGYDFNHIIAVSKMILEEEERIRIANEG